MLFGSSVHTCSKLLESLVDKSVAHCKEAVAVLVGVDWNSISQPLKSLVDKRSQWHIAVGSSKHEA